MTLTASPENMFSDVKGNPVALSERFDAFKSALASAPWGQVGNDGQTTAGNLDVHPLGDGQGNNGLGNFVVSKSVAANPADKLRELANNPLISKAIGDELRSSLVDRLDGVVEKDLSLTNPLSTGLVLFDLKAPSEFLVPVETPIRNRTPRTQGVGTSYRFKQITGISGAQTTAGVSPVFPGFTDTTELDITTTGSATPTYLNRPPMISYAGVDKQVSYMQFGLSDKVPWSAEFAGQGFQDLRSLSQTSVLYASVLSEERVMLYGRGTSGNGFSGTITTPTGVMGAARSANAGETGISGSATLTVWLVADTGFGTAPAVQAGTGVAVTAGQVLPVTVPATAGAYTYRVFVSTNGSPTTANAFYYGNVGASFVLQGTMPTSGTAASAFSANSSALSGSYDGIIPIVTGTNSGYVRNLNTTLSVTNPGNEFNTAFAAMYAQNLANPDEILMNGLDRKQLSDTLKNAGNVNGYKLEIAADGLSGHQVGTVVSGIQNEVTGKLVDITVHPYLAQGTAPILSHTLPFPNSNVTSCWEARNVQDYVGINWPVIATTYDTSSYWFGTFFCHAPAWQGAITGIVAA